ncbi:FAD-dependent oxidoreductase [Desulfomonile tiedjei]|uniref:Pyridine nucleotide-disulfide oxidoreductase n=1 Tax=Desulfomonile tiedjei (strain ATCC 49306 / DSM 6799 / DCB-1) TaxID=706587 RepID=I4C024_DESTA|nr:FAD-dependent oxidoreductase [Desulfomonile tiedjei]AFM22915.1 Pyridine nucleotide-disulfide oxidoreductase [Desulfomonile tiedjei DSM 6799]
MTEDAMTFTNKDVVIIGGGVGGISSAVELDKLGIECLILEKTDTLGGHAASLCCKATETCQRCGACLVEDLIHRAGNAAHISTMLNTVVSNAQKTANGWRLDLVANGSEKAVPVDASAVVLATGFSPFDPALKPQFGYGRVPGVSTALELEYRIRADDWDTDVKKLAFIQCVGSRDHRVGNNYCSRVCCAYALRLGRLLKNRFPELDIALFYMDVQSFDRNFDTRLKAAQEDMRMVRAIPSQIRESRNGKPEIIYHGPSDERVVEEFDSVALSVGMTPGQSPRAMGELFGITAGRDGFAAHESSNQGLFLAGTVGGPLSIPESISSGVFAASQVASYVRKTRSGEMA